VLDAELLQIKPKVAIELENFSFKIDVQLDFALVSAIHAA